MVYATLSGFQGLWKENLVVCPGLSQLVVASTYMATYALVCGRRVLMFPKKLPSWIY